MRNPLPQRRHSESLTIWSGARPFTVTVGYYDDNTPGEIFINYGRAGTDMEALMRDAAVVLSLALQFGVPTATIRGAVTREGNGDASSIVGAILDKLS